MHLFTAIGAVTGAQQLPPDPPNEPGGDSEPSHLTTFTVDGVPHVGEDTIELEFGTISVTIAATNNGSISNLVGDTGLVESFNSCTFTITAEDGITTLDISIHLIVLADPASLTTFTVNGDPYGNGDAVYLPNGTTSVTIVATNGGSITTGPVGDTDLVPGNNTCYFSITSENEENTADFFIILRLPSNVTAFTYNTVPIENGAIVNFPNGTTCACSVFAATDGGSISDLTGNDDLETGDNICTFTITAEDGITTLDVSFTIRVAANNNLGFEVNGTLHSDGDVIVLSHGTTSATITAFYNGSISSLTGDTGLVTGDNPCTFTITAEDGIATANISITLRISALNLTTFTVNGTPKADGDTIEVANGTTSVTIAATNSSSITSGPVGDTGLATGNNTCTFTITAEDGITYHDFSITIHVADPIVTLSSLTTFTVNSVSHNNGDTVNLANGTSDVTIAATNGGSINSGPLGNTGLITGDNPCTFSIVAEDGITTLNASITLHVMLPVPTLTGAILDNGYPTIGDTLNVTPTGGTDVTTYTYIWKADGSAISGATSSSYVCTRADAMGHVITCVVTGHNESGDTTPYETSSTAAVTGLPLCTIAPVITTDGDNAPDGPARANFDNIYSTDGTWSCYPPSPSFTYAWYSGNGQVGNGSTYSPNMADIGTIYLVVTAYNGISFTVQAFSNSISVVGG